MSDKTVRTEELRTFLENVGLAKEDATRYAAACIQGDVDLNVFKLLKENHLKELSFSIGHRVLILNYLLDIEKKKSSNSAIEEAVSNNRNSENSVSPPKKRTKPTKVEEFNTIAESKNVEVIILKGVELISALEVNNVNLKKDKEKFEIVTYCNLYRRQIERFETLFAKKEFHVLFISFKETLMFLYPIFNEKRSENKLEVKEKSASFFRSELTRVEKWTTILVWLFICEFKIDKKDKKMQPLVGIIDKASNDFKTMANILNYKPVYALREYCFKNITIAFKDDFSKSLDYEITGIANGFNEGFQRCSKELKRWELSATPEEYSIVRKKLIGQGEEKEDDYIINLCLETIVNLGRDLAK